MLHERRTRHIWTRRNWHLDQGDHDSDGVPSLIVLNDH